tara:strand:- start:2346 stop:2807 length:462 start_codon:yes stop_codon:yes gene_type:complete
MLLYHFSDGKFKPGEIMPIGNYGKYVSAAPSIVQQFEKLMEISRKKITPKKPSRLNCIFAFNKEYANGFQCNRKYQYELEVPDIITTFELNYNVSTFFWNLYKANKLNEIKTEIDLMEDYWKNNGTYMTSKFKLIPFDKEFLISQPVKIIRSL